MMSASAESDSIVTPASKRVMIVAGEASGDLYGADLVQKALLQDPGLHFFHTTQIPERITGVLIDEKLGE